MNKIENKIEFATWGNNPFITRTVAARNEILATQLASSIVSKDVLVVSTTSPYGTQTIHLKAEKVETIGEDSWIFTGSCYDTIGQKAPKKTSHSFSIEITPEGAGISVAENMNETAELTLVQAAS